MPTDTHTVLSMTKTFQVLSVLVNMMFNIIIRARFTLINITNWMSGWAQTRRQTNGFHWHMEWMFRLFGPSCFTRFKWKQLTATPRSSPSVVEDDIGVAIPWGPRSSGSDSHHLSLKPQHQWLNPEVNPMTCVGPLLPRWKYLAVDVYTVCVFQTLLGVGQDEPTWDSRVGQNDLQHCWICIYHIGLLHSANILNK